MDMREAQIPSLMGKYPYQGKITASNRFDYFPYRLKETYREQCAADFAQELKPGCEEWRIICELALLGADVELLYRPFGSLSHGERTKVLLALLFSGENDFLLIDEPTNHLDMQARETVKQYLCKKEGFILVSHDRDLLDACVDHVLVLNRGSIQVQTGNFSSWWENKCRADQFAEMENEKHLHEIASLKKAVEQSRRWADKNEATKIGFDPVKEPDRSISTRSYISAKTKKMQSRVKNYERRIEHEIQEKEGLLQDIERPTVLKLMPLTYHKESLFFALLRQLDMERAQFGKPLEDFSEGQKKKVLIAASLMKPAHVYVWDEPLNYIDVFSRMQIEELILSSKPTMLVVEHDVRFREKIATRVLEI